MSNLAEIEGVVPSLGLQELSELENFVRSMRLKRLRESAPSALDLPPLDLGTTLRPIEHNDDLLEEMTDDSRD